MPYRAMLWTLLTVGLALLIVALWLRTVEPQLASAIAATQIAPATGLAKTQRQADEKDRAIIKITLGCVFILICLLFALGILGTFREWLRFQCLRSPEKKPKKTRYTDAWKIAGQRLTPPAAPDPDAPPPNPPDPPP